MGRTIAQVAGPPPGLFPASYGLSAGLGNLAVLARDCYCRSTGIAMSLPRYHLKTVTANIMTMLEGLAE